MKQIALIGANGFVGSALYTALQKNKNYYVQPISRKNYAASKKKIYDIVINAAMPSSRYWAEKNPYEDFIETVEKTADIVYSWNYKKIIQISTISARSEKKSVYGKHKALAEELCKSKNHLIIRLTAMYSDALTKGALIDIVNRKEVFVSGESKYSFASLSFVSEWIANNLDHRGIREVGAKNSLSLQDIAKHFNLAITFSGRLDIQEVRNPLPEFPDAKEVITFMQKKLK